jgi:hypothetical protein
MCCNNGKIRTAIFPEPPNEIKDLWLGTSEESRIFRENSRILNNALAFASQKVTEIRPQGGVYSPIVVLQGKVHTFVGPLQAKPKSNPKFAQIWVYDADHEQETNFRLQNMKLPIGTTTRVRYILTELLRRLQGVLRNIILTFEIS